MVNVMVSVNVKVRVKVRYKCERSDRLNPFHMQAAICCRGEQDLRGHCRFELWSTSGSSRMPDSGLGLGLGISVKEVTGCN